MKLKKTAREYLEMLYNEHLDYGWTKHKTLVNQLMELSDEYPQEFSIERFGSGYSFKIKRLGYLPDFLKGL